jgi:hypothetical protein
MIVGFDCMSSITRISGDESTGHESMQPDSDARPSAAETNRVCIPTSFIDNSSELADDSKVKI